MDSSTLNEFSKLSKFEDSSVDELKRRDMLAQLIRLDGAITQRSRDSKDVYECFDRIRKDISVIEHEYTMSIFAKPLENRHWIEDPENPYITTEETEVDWVRFYDEYNRTKKSEDVSGCRRHDILHMGRIYIEAIFLAMYPPSTEMRPSMNVIDFCDSIMGRTLTTTKMIRTVLEKGVLKHWNQDEVKELLLKAAHLPSSYGAPSK